MKPGYKAPLCPELMHYGLQVTIISRPENDLRKFVMSLNLRQKQTMYNEIRAMKKGMMFDLKKLEILRG